MKTNINNLLKKSQSFNSVQSCLLFFFLCGFNVITFSQNTEDILNKSTAICQKGQYHFNAHDYDSVVFDFKTDSCIPNDKGIPNEMLLNWVVDRPGFLSFMIEALMERQDIDFELYRIKTGQLHLIRCMATGLQIGESLIFNEHCVGVTGLQAENAKVFEDKGCTPDRTNFAAPIYVNKREEYLLRIINFSGVSDIAFELSGSAELTDEYAEINISVSKNENQKEWVFDFPILSNQEFANIKWDFGVDAFPERINNVNRATAKFKSGGEKLVRLSLERHGCQFQAQKMIRVGDEDVISLEEYSLLAHPNPFREKTQLTIFANDYTGLARMNIYSADGSLILHRNIELIKNSSSFSIDGSSWPSGSYTVKVSIGEKEVNSTLIKI